MHSLRPFDPCPGLRFEASLTQRGSSLFYHLELEDPEKLLLDGLAPGKRARGQLQRKDGLWQTTCFEAFWARPGEAGYWELNLSGAGAWNLYRFDGYRLPQPPRASDDFEIKGWESDGRSLRCELAAKGELPALEASLCVIARTAEGTNYFSTKHAGAKPDYHLRASFSLPVERR